jgi:hypothetical protein
MKKILLLSVIITFFGSFINSVKLNCTIERPDYAVTDWFPMIWTGRYVSHKKVTLEDGRQALDATCREDTIKCAEKIIDVIGPGWKLYDNVGPGNPEKPIFRIFDIAEPAN